MRSKTSIMLCVLTILAAAATASAQSPQEPTGSWANEASGQYFYMGGYAQDGTYLYIIGGYQYGVSQVYPWYYGHFRRYDPAGNTWTSLSDVRWGSYAYYAVYGNAGGYYDGNVYSFGGYHFFGDSSSSYSSNYSNAIISFSIADNAWSTVGSTLSVSRYLTAGTLAGNNRFYIAGGLPGPTTSNDEFDPSTGNVTSRATMPTGLYYHTMAAATVNNVSKVYAMCGYPGPTANLYEYTPSTNTWDTKAQVQNASGQAMPRYGATALTLNGRVYLTGGYAGGYSTQTFEYNPGTNLWAQRANMSTGRYLHAGVAIGNVGYVYGGPPNYTSGEAYTPPDFGLEPDAPSNVAQTGSRAESSLQSVPDTSQFDGWTNNQIQFSANVTDPNPGQTVRFRVQVKPKSAAWTQANAITSLNTNLGAQGLHTLTYNIPGDGEFDWRWRVEDSYLNSHPSALPSVPEGWVEAFGSVDTPNTNSPDFRSDQVPPSDPVGVAPHNLDIQVPDPAYGDVTLSWIESTDNGPVAGISYELQVATDGGFLGIEAQLFSTAGTDNYPITLTVSRYNKFWRMRARDVGGNLSNWSPSLNFRVTYNDGLNHSSGDAKRACGFSVGSGASSLIVALLGLALLARAGRGRFRM